MAESVKPRFAVDLDEIERQLAHSQSAPAQAPASHRNDPLAELARIVGQEDPFQTILAGDRAPAAPARDSANFDDMFVSRGTAQPAPQLRGSYDADQPTDLDAIPPQNARYGAYEQRPVESTYAPESYDQDDYAAIEDYADQTPIPQRDLPKRGSRKALIAVGAVVGAAALGVAGALMVGGPSTVMSSGEPPLITAANEPTKVQPQSPGGVEIPNQNKQIYERAAHEAPTKVVNREEQPVDVRQATRTASADATGATAVAPPTNAGLSLGEPRKVRTISIRPDGTVILPDQAPGATRAAAPASASTTPSAPPAAVPVAAAQPSASPVPAATTPIRVASATPTTPAPRTTAATPATSGGSSPQVTPPAPAQPAPQRVASVQPAAVAAVPEAVEAVAAGGFAVQLGVSQSEGDAQTTLQRLQQKFSDLNGKAPMIRKAEVNGNTVFRVRVGPMSREAASSLCSKIQGQGGQCFVAKN